MQRADTAMYVRADDNDIVVLSPRIHAAGQVGDAFTAEAAYTMDSWTGASIDVVTAATDAIHELRHEINTGVGYELDNASLSASYRYSTENDYWSHGGVVGVDLSLAQNNTTLGFALLGSNDTVGRANSPSFRRELVSAGGRVAFSQVLDKKTLAQLSADMVWFNGYQASPYRYVGVGGAGLCGAPLQNEMTSADGTMMSPADDMMMPPANGMMPAAAGSPSLSPGADLCLPEKHPHTRLRTAFSGNIRRALAERLSAGVSYRYYFDDWGLSSHTALPDVTVLIGDHGTLSLSYRFYIQSRADFYLPTYTQPADAYQYVTRDRKLSEMLNHHVGAQYVHEFPTGESGSTVWDLGLRGGYTRFHYTEFVGLEWVNALEVTTSLGLSFR